MAVTEWLSLVDRIPSGSVSWGKTTIGHESTIFIAYKRKQLHVHVYIHIYNMQMTNSYMYMYMIMAHEKTYHIPSN